MSDIRFIILAFLLFASAGASSLTAQQVEEQAVELQKIFIDASREKVLGNLEEAAKLFEQVLDKDENNHAAAFELGRIYDSLENDQKALRYLKRSAELDPANEWYLRFLADYYQETNRNSEAAELYEQLVERHPDNEHYYFRWAFFLVRSKDLSKAIKVYDQLEKRIGVNEEVIRRKHALYLGAGDHKRAGRELERLIEAFPRNLHYRHLLAGFYEQIGETEQAREVYREILAIDPQDAKAGLALAGNTSKNSDEIEYLLSLAPLFGRPDVDIDLKIGQLFPIIAKVADTGDRDLADAALDLTDLLEQAHPAEAKPFSAAGDLLYHSGRPREALKKYQATLERNESVFSVWEQILHIYREGADYDNLAQTAEEAMDLFPNKALLYYMAGLAQYELDDYDEALGLLDQANFMAGDNGRLKFDVYHYTGLAEYERSNFNAAFDAFDRALELNPEGAAVLNDYSYRLAEQGYNLPKAEAMARLANELFRTNPDYQATYAWVFYKQKAFKKAGNWLEKALENGGETRPRILEQYGDVLFQLQEKEQAVRYWKKAREQGGESPLLDKKINDQQLYEQ